MNASNILSSTGDTRLRNLENIYMKPPLRNARNNNNSKLMIAAKTTTTGFDKDKWSNRSDSEERVINEVAKMNTILDKEAKLNKKETAVPLSKGVLDGGWI